MRDGYESRLTCARVSVFECACVCEFECMDNAVHSPAYVQIRVSLYKDVNVYSGVLLVCLLSLCVHMPFSSPESPSAKDTLLPPCPVSWSPRGLNPATHRGGGSGSSFSPGPTHLGRVATPLQPPGLQWGKPLYRPREGGIPVTFPCVTPYALFHWLKV